MATVGGWCSIKRAKSPPTQGNAGSVRFHQPVQMDNEIAHRGIIDRRARDRLPCLPRFGIAGIQPDHMQFRRIDEFTHRAVLQLPAKNEVKKLFVGMVVMFLGHRRLLIGSGKLSPRCPHEARSAGAFGARKKAAARRVTFFGNFLRFQAFPSHDE